MDRVLNSNDEKNAIYEIYRACRLCGAGAGYKMPIIQNVIKLDGDGVELRQKIKECVQINVHHTDRMPPLICELCVDKVNEFYEFLDMCKRNNNKTRLRLGLPLQNMSRDSINENCILGVTEPIFIESETESSSKIKNKKAKTKEAADSKIKLENFQSSPKPELKPKGRESRDSSEEPRRGWKPAPSPHPRRTRLNADLAVISQAEDLLVEKSKLKRSREKETKMDTPPPNKKVRTALEPVKVLKPMTKTEPVSLPKPGPKSMKIAKEPVKEKPKEPQKTAQKPETAKPATKKDIKPSPPKAVNSKALATKALAPKAPAPKASDPKALHPKASAPKASAPKASAPKASDPKAPKPFYCQICKLQTKNSQGFAQHNTKHLPSFTNPKYACNACELWFSTTEETNNHHKNHRIQNIPYKCSRCYGYFKLIQAYDDHFVNELCLSVYEVPDVKCWECWRSFPTNKLMEEHRCAGEDGRPGGKCGKCKRNYALLKNLVKHESTCTHKKKGEVTVDPEVRARLLPMQVRVARCDPLLTAEGSVDTSKVPHEYGLDSKWRYPYLAPVRVKPELSPETFNHMVSIDEDIKEEFNQSFVHWDSSSDESDVEKKVNSLSAISLKTLFSKKCLGKVPKRKRVIKTEVLFDTVNDDIDLGKKINSIIDNLLDEDAHTSCSYDSDSILDKNNAVNASDSKNDSNKLTDNATDASNQNNAVNDSDTKNDSNILTHDGTDDSNQNNAVNGSDAENDSNKLTNYDSDDSNKKNAVNGSDTKKYSNKLTNDGTDDSKNSSEITQSVMIGGSDAACSDSDNNPDNHKSDDKVKNSEGGDTTDEIPLNRDVISEKFDDISIKSEVALKIDDSTDKCGILSEKLADTSDKYDSLNIKLETSNKLNNLSEKCDGTPENVDTENITANIEINSIVTENYEESMKKIDDNKSLIIENGAESIVDAKDDASTNNEKMHDSVKESDRKSLNNDNNNQNGNTITQNHDENEQSKINNDSTDNRQLESFNETKIDRLTNEQESKNDNVDSNSQSVADDTKLAGTEEILKDESENMEEENDTQYACKEKEVINESENMELDEQNNPTENDTDANASMNNIITNLEKPPENNENFSKIDEITNKILKENNFEDKHQTYSNDDNHQKSDPSMDSISLNSIKSENGIDNLDKFNVNDLSEDDRQLMAELDAQIGENDKKTNENDQNFIENDHTLDDNKQKFVENAQKDKDNLINDLLRKQDSDLKSLDLDSISDEEFNFDM